jgi:nickel superoxide dismutase
MLLLVLFSVSTVFAARVQAHCQVPCGIYDDQARIAQMLEDTETIRKAMTKMSELSGKADAQSMNQLTRWVMTKEQHASRIITTVSEYFLTQKVKPVAGDASGYDAYLRKLADHHAVMTAAMKSKQNADVSFAAELHEAIEKLAGYYKQ